MNFVKPLDKERILDICPKSKLLVTIEINSIQGGAGSSVNEFLAYANKPMPILNLGLPDEFINHAEQDRQLHYSGLSKDEILKSIKKRIEDI